MFALYFDVKSFMKYLSVLLNINSTIMLDIFSFQQSSFTTLFNIDTLDKFSFQQIYTCIYVITCQIEVSDERPSKLFCCVLWFFMVILSSFFFWFLLLALTFQCHSKAKAEVQSLFFSNITTNKNGNLSNEWQLKLYNNNKYISGY